MSLSLADPALAPDRDLEPAPGNRTAPTPSLGPVDALYARGLETVFGDRWTQAYDRFVQVARTEGPAEAARLVGQPGALVSGTPSSPVADSLSRAFQAEAARLAERPGQPLDPVRLDDARVQIRSGPEVDDGRIAIDTTVYLYGSGATQTVADTYAQGIRDAWATRPDGTPWTYTSPSGESYRVDFNVDVRLYDPQNPERSPGLFSGRLNPFNRDNFIEVSSELNAEGDPVTSMVRGGDEGVWRDRGRSGLALAVDNPAAHELGHILGLPDRYIKDVGPQAGWEGNIMAMPAGFGVVEQRDIDTLVRAHVEAFERAGLPPGQSRTSSINP